MENVYIKFILFISILHWNIVKMVIKKEEAAMLVVCGAIVATIAVIAIISIVVVVVWVLR